MVADAVADDEVVHHLAALADPAGGAGDVDDDRNRHVVPLEAVAVDERPRIEVEVGAGDHPEERTHAGGKPVDEVAVQDRALPAAGGEGDADRAGGDPASGDLELLDHPQRAERASDVGGEGRTARSSRSTVPPPAAPCSETSCGTAIGNASPFAAS